MYQSYTKKIQTIEEDVSRIIETAYSSLEKLEGSYTYNSYLSYVKMKEMKAVIFGRFVKLSAIAKITTHGSVEYKIRGFQVKSRSYYNYSLYHIPLEVKAQLADYLRKKAKLRKFIILDSSGNVTNQ